MNVSTMGLVVAVMAAGVAMPAMAMKLVEDKPAVSGPELDYSKAGAGTYIIDGKHVSVVFNVWHMGFSHYMGRFDTVSGTLKFDPANLKNNSVSVSIDPASMSTGYDVMDEKLRSAEFFDVQKFPTMQFEGKDVAVTGKNAEGKATGTLSGNLTMHGVTKPVVLNVTFNGSGANPISGKNMLGFSATSKLKRSDFGLNYGIPMVGDDVEIRIEVEMVKAG